MAGYFGIHDLIATGDLGYGYCQHVLGQLLILLTALPTVQISQTDLSLLLIICCNGESVVYRPAGKCNLVSWQEIKSVTFKCFCKDPSNT